MVIGRTAASPAGLARAARERFATEIDGGIVSLAATVQGRLATLAEQVTGSVRDQQLRRDTFVEFQRARDAWIEAMASAWRQAAGGLQGLAALRRTDGLERQASSAQPQAFTLLSDDEIEQRILVSRLVSMIDDHAGTALAEMRVRVAHLEDGRELASGDVLRTDSFPTILVREWRNCGLNGEVWALTQDAVGTLLAERMMLAARQVNEFLIASGVLPVIDHRVRRSAEGVAAPLGAGARASGFGPGGGGGPGGGWGGPPGAAGRAGGAGGPGGSSGPGGSGGGGWGASPGAGGPGGGFAGGGAGAGGARAGAPGASFAGGAGAPAPGWGATRAGGAPSTGGSSFPSTRAQSGGGATSGLRSSTMGAPSGPQADTRLMTGTSPLARARAKAQGVLGQLKRLLVDRGAEFDVSRPAQTSPALSQAMSQVYTQRPEFGQAWERPGAPPASVEDVREVEGALRERTAELKRRASTATEKATIEVVALMFQAILAEERIAPSLRVWFARLQMPVLRVALAEPDFFSTLEHPARQLIDRMGSVALGFDASSVQGSALEAEVRRVVQVIEQYPETGRRVFRIVLDEFKQFLKRFLTESEGTQKLVSVAQQVEQKETLTIQYTIELRKMLEQVRVGSELREFLFKVWAEVLALSTLRHGPQHEVTLAFKRAAPELLWAASAKTTREDRARVIRTLPVLLQKLREGMTLLALPRAVQDEHIRVLNDEFAKAFLAKTEAISQAQIDDMAQRLDALEAEVADDAQGEVPLTPQALTRMFGEEASAFELLANTGEVPGEGMRVWAQELELGHWFTLEHLGKLSRVQLVWRSPRKELALFSSGKGVNVLFQKDRLALFLQAGQLVPVEDETLTVRATREAIHKLDANPGRLLD